MFKLKDTEDLDEFIEFEEESVENDFPVSQKRTTKLRSTATPTISRKRVKPKVVVGWTEENVLKLIACVELEECLWNAGNPEYKNKIKRMGIWRQISDQEFDGAYTADDLLAKWTNIRIQFKTQATKKKATKSGQATEAKRDWKYYQAMKFVEQAEDEQTTETISNLVRVLT